MSMKFNEDSRVKIPTVLHLCRLGYTYLSLKGAKWDKETNVFPDLFEACVGRIIPGKRNQKLVSLRDCLLPMLMNGQLRARREEEGVRIAAEPEGVYFTKTTLTDNT
jgi:type I restriction enzyme R subunit